MFRVLNGKGAGMRGGMMLAATAILAGCGDRETQVTRLDGGTGEVVRLDGAGPLADGSPPAFSDKMEVKDGRGLYTANRRGRLTRIAFDLPMDRVAPEDGHLFAPVGETDDGIVVLVDDYGSKSPTGSDRCSDGTETFVRVFSLVHERQLLSVPVGSCLQGTKAPTPETTWLAPDRFRIETTPKRVYALSGTDGVDLIGGE